ncbi:Phosphomevalonate kinase [Westerdykella ornata]|uniref:Phosphomevalonate kinase n=1 Tax=Westerdykella ornata TaxID=318751 RepID=A0A6A6JSP5_WESOR|nr:Phosphomevalonate kinase [Westerdykella ornata]KAF2279631.1 Phosphomevalonate kinase [Westerdykella ornata]
MTASTLPPKAVSAPGKVLLAGGYLVLDRNYTGLVFGLDARIHVYIEPIKTKSGVTLSEIIVKSPQFREATWEFGYRLVEGEGGIGVTQLRANHTLPLRKNPFIETTLTYTLTYITTLLPHPHLSPSTISILASPAYYSNPGTSPSSSTSSPSPFLKYPVSLPEAHKTGLGSSAALVTSFTAALLTYYLPTHIFDLETDAGLRILHNLSQAAHCAAQGKVGSGFDIASAVYGSCLYRRFSPSLLSSLPAPGSPGFSSKLKALVEGRDGAEWDVEIRKAAIRMPRGLRLVMCDVDCGSETPGMVKKVLGWRAEHKDTADRIWDALQQGNEEFAAELTRLAGEEEDAGKERYAKLRDIIARNRALIREMGQASGVPIEPPQQTALLDACSKIEGIIGGVVPGAGGYDAVVLLVEDREEVMAELKKLLAGWKEAADEENGVKIGKVGILGVREDMVGVRLEDPTGYTDWLD